MWQRLRGEDRAGLYITVIFHLTVIIVLLSARIGSYIKPETSFVLDFSKQEEIEQKMKEEEFKADISKQLDDMIKAASSQSSGKIRNLAVDAGSRSNLKDDRGTDAKSLYEDAQRLEKELKNGQRSAVEEDAKEETVDISGSEIKRGKEYTGPSVVSYNLDGRKASHLKIPAYRCVAGGDVTVIITVDNQGKVVNAKVYDPVSSEDECLRNFAVRAARLSRFSADAKAPANQKGEIVYRFIAQ
ncbi:MAG: energy transducer TonB [Candidatus Cryptobacteroides sp.]